MWITGFKRLIAAVEALDGEAEMPYRKAVELQESLVEAKQEADAKPSYEDLMKCVEMLAAIQSDNVPWWMSDCHELAVKLVGKRGN